MIGSLLLKPAFPEPLTKFIPVINVAQKVLFPLIHIGAIQISRAEA